MKLEMKQDKISCILHIRKEKKHFKNVLWIAFWNMVLEFKLHLSVYMISVYPMLHLDAFYDIS